MSEPKGVNGYLITKRADGWHLIGHTDMRLFDPQATPPAALAPGDMVQFSSVER